MNEAETRAEHIDPASRSQGRGVGRLYAARRQIAYIVAN